MYEEAAPPRRLAGVARCVWRSASAGPKRIVPDGCLDLVVGDGGVFVAGPDTAAWSSVTRPGAVLRGVRFRPGHAPAVLGVAADELRDRRVSLGELWGRDGEVLAERLLAGELSPAEAVESRLASVEVSPADWAVAELIERLDAGAARVAEAAALLARRGTGHTRIAAEPGHSGVAEAAAPLARGEAAPRQIAAKAGHPDIAEAAALLARGEVAPGQIAAKLGRRGLAEATALLARGEAAPGRIAQASSPDLAAIRVEEPFAVSERRLRRRFVQAVGYGPATYLRVARFQRAVALATRVSGLAALAVAAGYSDQAHLSRDCRALTGLTPRRYFPAPSTVDAAERDRLRSA
ncbi:helix-turn-helix domain-containing protein [Amycolatopsis sp. MEPSY49]|uniref:helix-turn-helix domain-containing protein n=1 Tax=Amycolatopsis sp. MEPSY49 TaxID=3151600 RepID=UPI003EF38FA8